MDESIVERIITLMEYYGLSSSAFADKVDVQRSSMSHLVSGRNKPSLDFIQKVLNQFTDINPTWLIMGIGPMKQLALFDDSGEPAAPVPLPAATAVASAPAVSEVKPSYTQQELPRTFEQAPPVLEPTIKQEEPIIQPTVYKSVIPEVPFPSKEQLPPAPPKAVSFSEPATEKSAVNDKKVTKIVFFYSDNTFETFNPS